MSDDPKLKYQLNLTETEMKALKELFEEIDDDPDAHSDLIAIGNRLDKGDYITLDE